LHEEVKLTAETMKKFEDINKGKNLKIYTDKNLGFIQIEFNPEFHFAQAKTCKIL